MKMIDFAITFIKDVNLNCLALILNSGAGYIRVKENEIT